jgi:hypothetical protein
MVAKAIPGIMHYLPPFLVDTGLRITEACMRQRDNVTWADMKLVAVRVVKGSAVNRSCCRCAGILPKKSEAVSIHWQGW